jgi:hypothetical protein
MKTRRKDEPIVTEDKDWRYIYISAIMHRGIRGEGDIVKRTRKSRQVKGSKSIKQG